MNRSLATRCFFLLLINSWACFAGSDPVSWSIDPPTGFPITPIGNESVVNYTLTNHLPGPVTLVTTTKITGTGFTVTDRCNGVRVARNARCIVSVKFEPLINGTSTFQLVFGYNNNRIPLPLLSASTLGTAAPALTGLFTEQPPPPVNDNEAPFFTATYVNTGNLPLTNCHRTTDTGFTLNPANAATITNVIPRGPVCGTANNPTNLAPGASCSIYGQLTGLQVTPNVTLASQLVCDNANANPSVNFVIQANQGVCRSLSVQPVLPLPTTTYKYADNVVQFRITNECPNNSIDFTVLVPNANGATITPAPLADFPSGCFKKNNPVPRTLNAGESCLVSYSIIPSSVDNLTITAIATPTGGQSASAATSTVVETNQQEKHHIKFINQCNFDVWYGVANGNGDNCPGVNCKSPDPNLIDNPAGALPDAYHLPAQIQGLAPSTIDLSVASYQNGAFWPRTGCDFNTLGEFVCATGTCATMPNSATCNNSGDLVQPQLPYTKFEANLNPLAGTDGVYDVSTINGMTVPVEVKALGPTLGKKRENIYTCSAAGAVAQPDPTPVPSENLGDCSWQYDPSKTLGLDAINNDFYWVTHGPDNACNANQGSLLCGMAWGSGPDDNGVFGTPINRRLGAFLGFSTLNNYTAYKVRANWGTEYLFEKYGMNIQIKGQSASAPGGPITNYGTIPGAVLPNNSFLAYDTLISCPKVTDTGALDSCYKDFTDANASYKYAKCCGCVNWTNTVTQKFCGLDNVNYSANMNYDWTGTPNPLPTTVPAPVGNYSIQNSVQWIKDACPTAYAYTYDDPSSSFSCTQDNGTDLLTSYEVTFCPGGVSGLPANALEGRNTPP